MRRVLWELYERDDCLIDGDCLATELYDEILKALRRLSKNPNPGARRRFVSRSRIYIDGEWHGLEVHSSSGYVVFMYHHGGGPFVFERNLTESAATDSIARSVDPTLADMFYNPSNGTQGSVELV